MALSFGETAGAAKKGKINWYKFKEGDNEFRIVGDILPMYVYWKRSNNGQNLPIECLSFDRDQEKFTNETEDMFLKYFPKNEKGEDSRPSWAYTCQAIDEKGELCVVQLKKKLFTEQIQIAAEDLGDPTNPDTGWIIKVKRTKTGPLNYNVSYTLKVVGITPTPLTDDERELIKDMKTIDELIPRPSVESQENFIKKFFLGEKEDEATTDVAKEFDNDGDLPA